jgi:hypothetical protein
MRVLSQTQLTTLGGPGQWPLGLVPRVPLSHGTDTGHKVRNHILSDLVS